LESELVEEKMKSKSFVIVAALLLAAACSTNTTMTSSSTMPGMNGMTWSDADIAAIVSNANQGEIDEGQVATTSASSDDVRAFARMMVTDHSNALNQAKSLLSRNNITPNMNNDIANTLQNGANQTVTALRTYTGNDFDRQYMQSQVDAHQWLLQTLDSTLIPGASNRQLRDFLKTQRTAVAAHLDRARQIQTSMR
jgi:putative membrane protein